MIPPNVTGLLIRFGIPALAVILAIATFNAWLADVRRDTRREVQVEDRANGLAHALNQMEKADDVRREINDPASRARHDECMRSARTPENCQRLLPQ